MNMIVQQTAAVASAMLSAANTPLTPQKLGRISAGGTRRMTFLRRAMNSDIEVNMDATRPGKIIMSSITAALKENMVMREILKHSRTLAVHFMLRSCQSRDFSYLSRASFIFFLPASEISSARA